MNSIAPFNRTTNSNTKTTVTTTYQGNQLDSDLPSRKKGKHYIRDNEIRKNKKRNTRIKKIILMYRKFKLNQIENNQINSNELENIQNYGNETEDKQSNSDNTEDDQNDDIQTKENQTNDNQIKNIETKKEVDTEINKQFLLKQTNDLYTNKNNQKTKDYFTIINNKNKIYSNSKSLNIKNYTNKGKKLSKNKQLKNNEKLIRTKNIIRKNQMFHSNVKSNIDKFNYDGINNFQFTNNKLINIIYLNNEFLDELKINIIKLNLDKLDKQMILYKYFINKIKRYQIWNIMRDSVNKNILNSENEQIENNQNENKLMININNKVDYINEKQKSCQVNLPLSQQQHINYGEKCKKIVINKIEEEINSTAKGKCRSISQTNKIFSKKDSSKNICLGINKISEKENLENICLSNEKINERESLSNICFANNKHEKETLKNNCKINKNGKSKTIYEMNKINEKITPVSETKINKNKISEKGNIKNKCEMIKNNKINITKSFESVCGTKRININEKEKFENIYEVNKNENNTNIINQITNRNQKIIENKFFEYFTKEMNFIKTNNNYQINDDSVQCMFRENKNENLDNPNGNMNSKKLKRFLKKRQKKLVYENAIVANQIKKKFESNEENVNLDLNKIVINVIEKNNFIQMREAKQKIHSKNFKPYCNQWPMEDLTNITIQLVKQIVKFQDRFYQTDPIKAQSKRKYVVGFNEIKKSLPIKSKVKLLIISPDIESVPVPGGLEDEISNLLSMATIQCIPYVFSIPRRKLGYITKKKVPVSCLAIIDYSSCESLFNEILIFIPKVNQMYEEKLKKAEEN